MKRWLVGGPPPAVVGHSHGARPPARVIVFGEAALRRGGSLNSVGGGQALPWWQTPDSQPGFGSGALELLSQRPGAGVCGAQAELLLSPRPPAPCRSLWRRVLENAGDSHRHPPGAPAASRGAAHAPCPGWKKLPQHHTPASKAAGAKWEQLGSAPLGSD
ncbi:unnamed protein product [Rangifer tarandus platyrhynchus]|uniref:Uncharacterized protein n=1 Tax=Rangifer tarandus platyrhynchus TaxID=3082113 RepID=A0AC60A5K6_RANTA